MEVRDAPASPESSDRLPWPTRRDGAAVGAHREQRCHAPVFCPPVRSSPVAAGPVALGHVRGAGESTWNLGSLDPGQVLKLLLKQGQMLGATVRVRLLLRAVGLVQLCWVRPLAGVTPSPLFPWGITSITTSGSSPWGPSGHFMAKYCDAAGPRCGGEPAVGSGSDPSGFIKAEALSAVPVPCPLLPGTGEGVSLHSDPSQIPHLQALFLPVGAGQAHVLGSGSGLCVPALREDGAAGPRCPTRPIPPHPDPTTGASRHRAPRHPHACGAGRTSGSRARGGRRPRGRGGEPNRGGAGPHRGHGPGGEPGTPAAPQPAPPRPPPAGGSRRAPPPPPAPRRLRCRRCPAPRP